MFLRLIEDLRAEGPLSRDRLAMGRLLTESVADWAGPDGLLFRAGSYTRTCAYRDERFELLLLNWAPGAASPIHDHGDQHCWMLVLEGQLEVDDYARLDSGDVQGYAHVEQSGSRTLDPGAMDLRSGRFDLHRVVAGKGAPAVSLHVYSAPLRRFFVYDQRARRCENAYGSYDDVLPAYAATTRR